WQTLRVRPEGKPVPTFPDHALTLSRLALETESAPETERIVGIGMTVEPKRQQRREDALRIFVLKREALDHSGFDGEAHQLCEAARKRESAPRLVNPHDVKVHPQRNHL